MSDNFFNTNNQGEQNKENLGENNVASDVTKEINYSNNNFSDDLNNNFTNNFDDNFNKDNRKKKKPKTKRLPTLGLALMILGSSVLGGVVGAFGVTYINNYNTSSSAEITKNNNLTNKVTTTSTPKTTITKVAEEVGPAVVGIYTTKSNWIDATSSESSGSGIVFSEDGYIVTNQHVIAGGTKIMVSLPTGKKVQAKIIGQDTKTDLAVLKVDAKGLTAAKFGDSDAIRVGDSVIAIGNPLGEEFAGSVTSGIVSAKDRNMSISESGSTRTYNVIQTDASINPGNSGGALLNASGEVIGINTLKISSAEGMGFAIPINEAKTIINELMKTGYVKRPYLGVATVYLDEATAKMYNIPSGVGIQQVVQGSPAEKAGLKSGDIITEIDGNKIKGQTDLSDAVNKKKIGDSITLKIANENGNSKTVKVTLEENKNTQQ